MHCAKKYGVSQASRKYNKRGLIPGDTQAGKGILKLVGIACI